ncbi:hypothetical protein BH24ACT15_BH24ACT15_38460 [soil metagenome]
MPERQEVMLREEQDGENSRYLWAYLDGQGDLHIDGQDLGPATAPVSSDGEYEWFKTIAASELPTVLSVLGASPEDDILEVVGRFRGRESYTLERLLRESDIPIATHVYSG